MTTTTLMRITRDTEGLGGITNDRGSVNVARVTSIPGATTPEQGLVRSAAEAFLLAVLKERRLRLRGADGGGGGGGPDAPQGAATVSDGWEQTDDPAVTTDIPPKRYPTYNLLDQ